MINSFRFKIMFPAICLLFLSCIQIHAELRTVTTLADTNEGACDAHCSLREAVAVANDGDTIIFERSLRGGTIQLEETLVIEKTLKIDGPNRQRITLSGNGTFRILYITSLSGTGPWKDVWLDGLIIRGGAALNEHGGGIYLLGGRILTLTDCVVTKNHAAFGGGIQVANGVLYLFDSTISDNTSDGTDGAAGIDALYAPGLHIVNSTVAGNIAADGAGGIKSQPERLLLLNSTVSGNISKGNGLGRVGGIFTYNSGNLTFNNSIIAGNIGETPDVLLWSSSGSSNLIGIGEGSRFPDGVA
ncbi:MAG TPA: right-handed parallel beta-helix repeat-containing protein, partial [Pyrinomonadaceae bacterium]|nr:right-handed parallel beta-helix repeat-containing protein [Pyrinomonadaceae bacterium]